ncbi:hypothetical protein [Colwellia sp. MEBiC06753]
MKIFLVSLLSFLIGLVMAGYVALTFFVYGGQSVVATEIQFYANTLQLINVNKLDEVVKRSCFALPIALENKAQLDGSLFASNFEYGMTDSGEPIESLAAKHFANSGICHQD